MARGKFFSAYQAQKAYDIRGKMTVKKWVRKYGRDDLLSKRIRIETMAGVRIGRDRFFKVLGEKGLLLNPLPKAPRTTNSRHYLPVFTTQFKGMELTKLNEAWVDQAVLLYNTRRPHLSLKYKTPEYIHKEFKKKVA